METNKIAAAAVTEAKEYVLAHLAEWLETGCEFDFYKERVMTNVDERGETSDGTEWFFLCENGECSLCVGWDDLDDPEFSRAVDGIIYKAECRTRDEAYDGLVEDAVCQWERDYAWDLVYGAA